MIQTPSEAHLDLLLRRVGEDGLPWGRSAAAIADEFGAPLLAALRRSGLGREEPLVDGDRTPCPGRKGEDCPRRVFEEEDGLVARCGLTPACCPTVRLDGDAARHVCLDARGLAAWLGPRLGLDGDASRVAGAVRVGERPLGSKRIAVYLLPDARAVDSATVRSWKATEGRRHLLGVAPHTHRIPAELLGIFRLQQGFVFGLDRLIDVVDDEVTASLAGIAPELGEDIDLDVTELAWPRYWLVFEEERDRAFLGPHVEALDLSTKPGLVLRRLLRDRGKKVTTFDLYRAGWNGALTAPKPNQKLDMEVEQAVRDAVKTLRAGLEKLPGEVSKRFVVETERAPVKGMGGYRLEVPRERVLLLGRP